MVWGVAVWVRAPRTLRAVVACLLALLLLLGAMTSLARPAFAATDDILVEACQSAPDSIACKDHATSASESPLTGTNGILFRASRIVAGIAGVIAIIMAIISGFRYITSGGDSQKAAEAKKTIIGALIGLVVIVVAQTIITFVIKRIN